LFSKRKINKMRFVIIVSCFLLSVSANAADAPYAVSKIPAHLLKNANIVKRIDDITYEFLNLDEVVVKKKYAFTILNEDGKKWATFYQHYSKGLKINSIEGRIYDAQGDLLSKLKTKDITDQSAVDEISLIDDNRIKIHEFNYNAYPYTIEYEVEFKKTNSYMFTNWIPQSGEKVSVEKSTLKVICTDANPIRHKAFNYKDAPTVETVKDKKIFTWKVTELPSITQPYASPSWHSITTSVFLSPSNFQMEKYKGSATTWQEFGKFALELNKGRDKLPPNVVQKVAEITAGITDERTKVKKLYEYLQANTRYISIQLGIGGLQPFEASYVAEKGYGDCKALSNYMYSILKAAGIKSYYTLIGAGPDKDDKKLFEDFSFDYFNHIVLLVPFAKDSMWLECTSQIDPAGYMGSFTGNRKALAITEEGGVLVNTPKYDVKENLQSRTIKGSVDEQGNLNMKVASVYKAQQQDRLFSMLQNVSPGKVKEILNDELDLSTYEIKDFKYDIKKDVLPQIFEQLDVYVSKYATISGKRIFITPNVMNKGGMKLSEEERKYDIEIDFAYKDVDTVEIDVPAGYQPESMPKDYSLKNKFGSYDVKYSFAENKVKYIRTVERYSGRFPAADYKEMVSYYNDIYKADRSRLVLVKKD
jgi:hypothetical protein